MVLPFSLVGVTGCSEDAPKVLLPKKSAPPPDPKKRFDDFSKLQAPPTDKPPQQRQ
jgi:hypothetical protein